MFVFVFDQQYQVLHQFMYYILYAIKKGSFAGKLSTLWRVTNHQYPWLSLAYHIVH